MVEEAVAGREAKVVGMTLRPPSSPVADGVGCGTALRRDLRRRLWRRRFVLLALEEEEELSEVG